MKHRTAAAALLVVVVVVVVVIVAVVVVGAMVGRKASTPKVPAQCIPSWVPAHVRPTPADALAMTHAIRRGREVAARSTMAVCCLVRDEVRAVERNVPEILRFLKENFRGSRMYVLENDSVDGTKDVLRDLEIRYPDDLRCDMRVGLSGTRAKKLPEAERMGLMTRLRQECIDWVLRDSERSDFDPDFIMIVDVDYDRLWFPGVLDSLGDADAWDVACANSISDDDRMYDWGSFGDFGTGRKSFQKQGQPFRMRSGPGRFRRYSYCFGSMSLYKTALVRRRSPYDARYGLVEGNPHEHTGFVRGLGGRVVANPNMILRQTWH